jgi:uncharacterized protein (UPF0335 family)
LDVKGDDSVNDDSVQATEAEVKTVEVDVKGVHVKMNAMGVGVEAVEAVAVVMDVKMVTEVVEMRKAWMLMVKNFQL